jgi:hypothetical protein
MKKLRKILVAVMLSLLLPVKSSPNMPVIDLSAIAATIAGFVESVQAATESGVTLLNQLDALEKTYDQMKQLKEFYDKIDAYVYNLQEIADIVETSTTITKMASDIYKYAANSRLYDPRELAFLLDHLTSILKGAASLTQRVSAILNPKLFKWDNAQRVKGIDEAKTAMTRIKESLGVTKKKVEDQTAAREQMNYLIKKYAASSLEAAYLKLSKLSEGLPAGMDMTYSLLKSADNEGGATEKAEITTESTSVSRMKGVAGKIAPLFWVLSAFVALFGLFKVVRKVQAQEDVGKAAITWVTAVLLLIIFGQLYTIIFS